MANTVEIVINAKDNASKTIQGVASTLSSSFKVAAAAAVGAGVAIGAGIAVITKGISTLAASAAELEGVRNAFSGLAKGAGQDANELLAALQRGSSGMIAQRDLMLSFNKAAQLVSTDFAVQLPEAMGYLGKVAAATGQDMDYMMNSLVVGVGRLSPLILDNLGIQASLAEATQRAAEMFEMEAEALSKAQIQAGMMDVVMEKLAINTANMPEVTQTAAAAVAQLRASLQDTGEQIGGFFLPAYTTVVRALVDSVAWFQSATAEGGFLYPVMVNLGAAAGILADGLSGLAARARDAGEAVYSEFGGRVQAVASAAFGWGVNITTQLAAGIIQGAAAALTAAMNFVSSILSWFLSPGSPPRVAPDIDKWGMAAMNEYLMGFTKASFGILTQLQQPIQNALASLVSADVLEKEAAAGVFKEISALLTYAVSEFQQTGTIYEGLLDKLREAGGEYGDQLVELARRQFAMAGANERMAKATDRVREAAERLVAAQDDQESSQSDLARITDEYNTMLLRGASYEELAAKRAEKMAAERRAKEAKGAVDAAKAEQKAAATEEKAAKKQLALDSDRLSVQSSLLDQMLLLAKTQQDMALEAEAGGGGGGGGGAGIKAPKGGGLGGLELPDMSAIGGGLGTGLTSGLSDAIDGAKEMLGAKFAELMQPFRDMLNDPEVRRSIDLLKKAWTTFSTTVSEAYDTYIQPVVDAFNEFIPPETRDTIVQALARITGFLGGLGLAAVAASLAITAFGMVLAVLLNPISLVIAAIVGLMVIWETNFAGIRTYMETVWWPAASEIFNNIMLWIAEKIIIPLQDLRTKWEGEVWPAIQTATENVWAIVSAIFEEIKSWLDETLTTAAEALRAVWVDTVWPAIQTAVETAWDIVKPIWETLQTWLETTLPEAVSGLQTSFETAMSAISAAVSPVKKLWDDFVSSVKSFWTWISSHSFKFNIGGVPGGGTKPEGNAAGTNNWGGGWTWVGERGPELLNLPRGSKILNTQDSWAFAPKLAMGMASLTGPTAAPQRQDAAQATTHVYIERIVLDNVQNAPDLLAQLQEMTVAYH